MGTVRRVGASDVPTIPASDATAVVAVEEVLHAPDAMAGFGGQEVTVRLAAPGSVSEGQRATFFTTVLAFGDSLGLAELEHQPAEEEVSALAGRVTDARASAAEQRMQDQVNRADVIVSGRVTDVRQPPAASVLAPGTETPVSEHDPQWMEAVVAVDSVVKGQPAARPSCCSRPAWMWRGRVRRSCRWATRGCTCCTARRRPPNWRRRCGQEVPRSTQPSIRSTCSHPKRSTICVSCPLATNEAPLPSLRPDRQVLFHDQRPGVP